MPELPCQSEPVLAPACARVDFCGELLMLRPLTSTPLISVIIPTHNRSRELALCLEGFAGQTVRPDLFEVIVIDDGCSSDTQPIIDKSGHSLRVKLLQTPHLGPGAARNLGLEHC